jgi:hypothetical protein
MLTGPPGSEVTHGRSRLVQEMAMPEGPLEFSADTPRPRDGARFDIYTDPHDLNRGTMAPNELTGRYVVSGTEYVEIEGATYLRVWYERAPTD